MTCLPVDWNNQGCWIVGNKTCNGIRKLCQHGPVSRFCIGGGGGNLFPNRRVDPPSPGGVQFPTRNCTTSELDRLKCRCVPLLDPCSSSVRRGGESVKWRVGGYQLSEPLQQVWFFNLRKIVNLDTLRFVAWVQDFHFPLHALAGVGEADRARGDEGHQLT